jgi:hypothetical protein
MSSRGPEEAEEEGGGGKIIFALLDDANISGHNENGINVS